MADEPAKPDAGHSPAGAPAEQRALDRPWRIWATVVVVVALSMGALLGFVIIPDAGSARMPASAWAMRCAALPASRPARRPSASRSAPRRRCRSARSAGTRRSCSILAAGNTRRGAAAGRADLRRLPRRQGHFADRISRASPGRRPYAIYKQLHDYRTGARAHPQMTGVAKALQPRDLASVAAYFADASKEYAALGLRDYVGEDRIDKLAREGDSRRRIPACLSCHVNGVRRADRNAGDHRAEQGIYPRPSSTPTPTARARTTSTAGCATSPAS